MAQRTMVQVGEVQTSPDYRAFVDLPGRVPVDRPMVRPMHEFQRHLFDRGRRFRGKWSISAFLDRVLLGADNPFYEHGDLGLFLARDQSGRPIGRIAAIDNRLYNEHHHATVGFFGFYECVDAGEPGREVTRALIDAASGWLRSRGLTSIRGPFNPTINDDCGIWLPGGHDDYPSFMMPSNPRYYAAHLHAAGLETVKTMRVYRFDLAIQTPTKMWQRWEKMAPRLERSAKITLRGANFKDLDAEVKSFLRIYNAALADNWGYAPMSFHELRSMAELFQNLVDPNLIRAAEVVENGERKVVGAAITIPDLNEILRHTGGRLLHPRMIWSILRMKLGVPTNRIRIMFLGILPEYRHTPASVALLFDSMRKAQRFGAREAEASWVLEDNLPMIEPIEAHRFALTDRYVIFEKGFTDAGELVKQSEKSGALAPLFSD